MSREPYELINVDAALTPKPKRDPWADDCDELTEDTGKANNLTWGRRADDLFATAHAAAEALRRLRRQQRDTPEDEQEPVAPKRAGRAPVANLCERCNRYYVGWHACSPSREVPVSGGRIPLNPAEQADVDRHFSMTLAEREAWADKEIRKLRERAGIEPEWRTVPTAPNYEMNSTSRALWRKAIDKTLPNGTIRHYPARMCTPKNGSYSLTVDGVTTSRGVNALWRETFGQKKERKKTIGESVGEIESHRNELDDYCGLAEWIGEGGARIVTRPK